jgi:hypothetical protein
MQSSVQLGMLGTFGAHAIKLVHAEGGDLPKLSGSATGMAHTFGPAR